MKSQLNTRLGISSLCIGGAMALAISCGDSNSSGTDMAKPADMAVTPPDLTISGPTIASLSSVADFTKGGTMTTISGANFRPGATVKFGTLTVAAADTTVSADGKTITVKVPANTGKPGLVDVIVTNSDSTSTTSANGFRYYLETISFGNATVVTGTGMGPRAVYATDLDGVKGPDLVVVNADSGSVSVFLNNGAGGFALKGAAIALQATCLYPYSAAVADVTKDGKTDLVLPCQNALTGEADFLKGNGDGTFVAPAKIPLTGANKPQAVVLYDLDGNQSVDMLVASNGTNTNNVYAYTGDGSGAFTALPAGFQAASTLNNIYTLKAFDLNSDGKVDNVVSVHTLDATAFNASVNLPNPVTPTTLKTTGKSPYDVASADFNNDGKADLVFANQGTNDFSLLLQGANSAFTVSGTAMSTVTAEPQAIAAADMDVDGKADVLTANYGVATGGDVSLFRGDGQGSFGSIRQTIGTGSSTTNGRPNSIVVADFNSDGRPDIAVTNYLPTGGQLVVLLNTGT